MTPSTGSLLPPKAKKPDAALSNKQGQPYLPSLVAAIQQIPPLRPIANELLTVVSREASSHQQCSNLIQTDPVFSAEVLRLANTAAVSHRGEISSMEHALLLLGGSRLQQLAVTLAFKGILPSNRSPTVMRCWRHAIATAVIARDLALIADEECDEGYTEWMYLSGLLHDLGRIVLIRAFPKEYDVLLAEPSTDSILKRERATWGLDNREAGLILLKRWSLPRKLQAEISHGGAVHEACLIATWMGFAADCDDPSEPFSILAPKLSATAALYFEGQTKTAEILTEIHSIERGLTQ